MAVFVFPTICFQYVSAWYEFRSQDSAFSWLSAKLQIALGLGFEPGLDELLRFFPSPNLTLQLGILERPENF